MPRRREQKGLVVFHPGFLLGRTREDAIAAVVEQLGELRLGERGLLAAVDAVVVSRPPTSTLDLVPSGEERARLRADQRDVVVETVRTYNPDAVLVVGVSFGHTKPHWILPYGGVLTVDGAHRRLWADFD